MKTTCRQCAAELQVGAAYCDSCGAQAALLSSPGRSCPSCRAPVAVGAAFCDGCGTAVTPAAGSEKSNRPALVAVLAGAVLVAVIAISLVSARTGREGGDQSTGARVIVGPGQGAVAVEMVETPTEVKDFLASPVYRLSADQDVLASPVEVRLDAPQSRWIVYQDDSLGLWIPVETTRDGGELVARVDHLSLWSTVTENADWLSTGLFKLIGNRADPPQCSGESPSWVTQFDAVPGNHPRLLACSGGSGDQATIGLKNNRGYPLWVTFNNGDLPVEVAKADYDFPTSFDGLVRLGFGSVIGEGRIYLDSLKQLTASFNQPESVSRTGVIETHGTIDAGLVAFHVVMEVLGHQGLVDIPLPSGKLLGAVALECYVKVPWATIALADSTRLLDGLEDLRKCFADSVAGDIKRLEALNTRPNDKTLKVLKGLERVLWAIKVTNWGQQFLDATLIDKPSIDAGQPMAFLGFNSRQEQTSVEDVDWRNHRYTTDCAGETDQPFTVNLADGQATHVVNANQRYEISFEKVAIGDVIEGGRQEAAVLLLRA